MTSEDRTSPKVNLMPPVVLSPTLAADALVNQLRNEGRDIFHMGFGQAPFPAPDRLIKAVQEHAHEKAYLPVAGLPELRQAVASHQHRLIGTDPDSVDVLVAPGSKLIIYAVQMAVAGDLLLPTPSWVSYAPQAAMLGQQTIPVSATLSANGFEINADRLEQTITEARQKGMQPSKLLINYPSNPTGLTIPVDCMKEIADVCVKHNVCIIADEIYGRLTFAGGYRSISEFAPSHTVVTTGLSKHLSLGGWRLGVGMVPKSMQGLFDALSGVASETWSCVAAPIQIAAVEAYQGHPDIESFVNDSTNIHASVTRYVSSALRNLGIACNDAQGGFYVYPEFSFDKDASSVTPDTSEALAQQLLQKEGIVTLPGTAFGEVPAKLTLRLSTCDYDGESALRFYRQNGISDTEQSIGAFAPRVVGAIKGFKQFMATTAS